METQQMNEKRWTIAHNLASDLIRSEPDREKLDTITSEFGKVIAFMRHQPRTNRTKGALIRLLQGLAARNKQRKRSGKTPEHYQNIQKSCTEHLKHISDPDELLLILGWSRRLMYYYKSSNVQLKPAAKQEVSRTARRQTQQQSKPPKKPKQTRRKEQNRTTTPQIQQPSKETEPPKFKRGDKVDAKVLKNDGTRVTVQLQTDKNEKLIFERSYYPGRVGKRVKLRVVSVDKDGQIVKEVIP